MKEIYSNINIIGGGLIGTVAAYSLSKLGFRITILEKKPCYNKKKDKDHRTTAISEGTKNFLDTIDLWQKIKPFAQPIEKIRVIDRKLSNQLEFDNRRRTSNLGYIIENKKLLDTIYFQLSKMKNVNILNNVIINNFKDNKENIVTKLNNTKIYSDLNIAADGRKSSVKKFFKTPYYFKNYKKNALVITITHTKNHNSTAYEFFYKNGPLAILPMQKNKRYFSSSIIWTNKIDYLKQIIKMDNKTLSSILKKETQNCIGDVKNIMSKQLFPLSAHLNSKFFEKRTVYIGDSAHSFHPIAGQGWNLGINDVEDLTTLITKYKSLGIEIGGNHFCKEFHKNNFYSAYRLFQITDKLDNIFQNQNSFVGFGRSLGINFINKNRNIKNLISDFAMGIN